MNAPTGMRLGLRGVESASGSTAISELVSAGVASMTAKAVTGIIEAERHEMPWPAYVHFALGMMNRESTAQELGPYYDKIFFRAESVSENEKGEFEINIDSGSDAGFVRLNEKIEAPVDTVGSLRSKMAPGILFSGVGALEIKTKNGIAYPIIQRDAGAPTDAGKFTLPAGRGDKTPGATAMEETLEEIVIFGKKNGVWEFVVPNVDNETISEGKTLQLAQIARYNLFMSLIRKGNAESFELADSILAANVVRHPLSESEGGFDVVTNFKKDGETVRTVREKGLFPMYDERANTYEIAKKFKLDLSDYDEIRLGDGDGFGRPVKLMDTEELNAAVNAEQCVFSLSEAVRRGILNK